MDSPSSEQGGPNVDQEGWPAWLESAFETFTQYERLRNVEVWVKLLEEWATLERKFGFENPGGPSAFYTKIGRPDLVDWWSRVARKKVRKEGPSSMPLVNAFAKDFQVWWAAINPEWRDRDLSNGCLRLDHRAEPKDKDRWEVMKKPGQCGILTVLVCLFHWHQHVETSEDEDEWRKIADDVKWVVGSMNKAIRY
ncbi:hypothetical protein K435DRAFT_676973 [Dendrothele bispora CBS 962.96]|uniref:Uncharacterized protein n=1 Tax=Dendrothele bispora (strain CBS 962.96) TaxID=1314807 RepID=A0A4S8LKX0_DENBC|nr:hypothetical protein K435DRAFT_676973 [Dendrothele bispora CBS 962.96]